MNSTLKPGTSSRRQLLTTAGVGAAAFAATGLLGGSIAKAVTPALTFSQIPGTGDVKVLNYALALEALETDLYVQALMRLTSGGTNAVGKKIVGLNLNFNEQDVAYVREFGKVEVQHRDFINAALGSASLLKMAPFNNAKFDFGIDKMTRKQVVTLIYNAEAIGVTAYLGAIPFFASLTYLQIAGSIQGTEARHTAAIADVLNYLFKSGVEVAPLAGQNTGRDMAVTPDKVLAEVSPFIVL